MIHRPETVTFSPEMQEKKFTPADFARMHIEKTGLGAVAFTDTIALPEYDREVPLIWKQDAERIPENFAHAVQVFKDTETDRWYKWVPQTTTFTTNRLELPQGEISHQLTYSGYYCHGFNEVQLEGSPDIALTGAGWDHRFSLSEYGWEFHGRTFTRNEISSPFRHMSREQMIRPELLSDEEVVELEKKLSELDIEN